MKKYMALAVLLSLAVCGAAEAKLPDFDARARQAVSQSIGEANAKQRNADWNLYQTAAAGSSETNASAMSLYYGAMNDELRMEAGRSLQASRARIENENVSVIAPVPSAEKTAEQMRQEEEQREADHKAMMARIEALRMERYQAELAALEKRK